jgi:hypothetical protein
VKKKLEKRKPIDIDYFKVRVISARQCIPR